METVNFSSGKQPRKILLVGDMNSAFENADTAGCISCEVCPNIPDAIDAAARGGFAAIAVVMTTASTGLSSALKALKQSSAGARIILLARMHEEPLAMRLVDSSSNGAALADDYVICPVDAAAFCRSVIPGQQLAETETLHPGTIDTATVKRIRLLEKLATEDDLTGLKSRRYVWEFGRQMIAHAVKENGRVTLLVFDIDNFKRYNDTYGHCAGDEILKQAAILMQRTCRQHDVVGRIGGDEFAVIFCDDPKTRIAPGEIERRSPAADHPKEAIIISQRFVRELETAELKALGPQGKGVLTISGALASFPHDGSSMQELFEKADKALLDAKHSGKNQIYLVGKPKNNIAHLQ